MGAILHLSHRLSALIFDTIHLEYSVKEGNDSNVGAPRTRSGPKQPQRATLAGV